MSFVANDRCFLESRARNRQSVDDSVKPDVITPSNLKERLDSSDPPVVLDVREDFRDCVTLNHVFEAVTAIGSDADMNCICIAEEIVKVT